MKVYTEKVIIIQFDGQKPKRFTEAREAAEVWARAKEEDWVKKHRDDKCYKNPYGRGGPITQLHGDGRTRYRKLKRRALAVFRKAMEVNS